MLSILYLTAEGNGRTRVVLNLGTMVAYETRRSGNTITITLGADGSDDEITTQFSGSSVASSTAPSYATSGARSIEAVDFRRTADGGGRVLITLSDPSTPVDIRQEGGRVVAIFKDTSLPAELLRRLDVVDFATPVTTVDALRTNGDTRVVISAEGKYEQLAYQSDTNFTIEINPAADAGQPESYVFTEDREYEGQRLTLNFQDIETRAVLQLLAETSGPQHRGVRHGTGQCDIAPAQRPLGPGARYCNDHQGSGHAPERQRNPGGAFRRRLQRVKRLTSKHGRPLLNLNRFIRSSCRSITPRHPIWPL